MDKDQEVDKLVEQALMGTSICEKDEESWEIDINGHPSEVDRARDQAAKFKVTLHDDNYTKDKTVYFSGTKANLIKFFMSWMGDDRQQALERIGGY